MEHIRVILKHHVLWITVLARNKLSGTISSKGEDARAGDNGKLVVRTALASLKKGRPGSKKRNVL